MSIRIEGQNHKMWFAPPLMPSLGGSHTFSSGRRLHQLSRSFQAYISLGPDPASLWCDRSQANGPAQRLCIVVYKLDFRRR